MEERFLQPANWQWGSFSNARELNIRFGFAKPEKPDATIVILPGRTEYIEKYFELTREFLSKNFAVYIIDWTGQGKSGRYEPFPERGHAPDFGDYVDDLHILISKHLNIKSPLIMLAHSMGGNIGMRYLMQYPDMFAGAAFTAPMIGIQQLRHINLRSFVPLLSLLDRVAGAKYAVGEKDWDNDKRDDCWRFSSDTVRSTIHNSWMTEDAAYRVGGVTYGWLYRALASCSVLQKKSTGPNIKTPCLIVLAGKETITDNKAARLLAARLPDCALQEIADSGHEILMERDEIRGEFLAYFYTFLHQNTV